MNALAAARTAIAIARNTYGNSSINPLPLIVQLVSESGHGGQGGNFAERDRQYVLKDSFGHVWDDTKPVTVAEIFSFISGNQGSYAPAEQSLKPVSSMDSGRGLGTTMGNSRTHTPIISMLTER